MSWFARSLANSLRLDDDEEDDEHENDVGLDDGLSCVTPKREDSEDIRSPPSFPSPEEEAKAQGVKDDLTELKQTLSRQFWDVANFLAPPPTTTDGAGVRNGLVEELSPSDWDRSNGSASKREEEASDSAAVSRIRNDLQQLGGRLRSGVSEVSKMPSNNFPFGSEENERENEERNDEFEEGGGEEEEEIKEAEDEEITPSAVGITDEVLAFARNIAMHPETWLDFPLDPDEDLNDFDMSEAQRDHALIIERLAPRLAALRIELCPCHMSESYFWKVYFVLLHSRLNKQDAEMLSTPQVVETRALWMQELQKQTRPDVDWYGRSTSSLKDSNDVPNWEIVSSSCSYAPPEFLSPSIYSFAPPSLKTPDYKMVRNSVGNAETKFIDKSVIVEETVSKIEDKDYEDDDDWPEEEDSEFVGKPPISLGNEEDISFSDLEDDDVCGLPIKPKTVSLESRRTEFT